LLVGEGADFLAVDGNHGNQLVLLEHGHDDECPRPVNSTLATTSEVENPPVSAPRPGDCQLHRAVHDRNYRFSNPHFFNTDTVQQPVSIQASYRFWQIRCVPQFDRACEQVIRGWADASL
jgi:hypothetical protein